MESSTYIGFVDGVSCHIQHLASASSVIYTPMGQVLSSGGVCLRPSSNNVVEYSVVIELLRDVISHGVLSLEVCLDSQWFHSLMAHIVLGIQYYYEYSYV